jgi:hypothetical protein
LQNKHIPIYFSRTKVALDVCELGRMYRSQCRSSTAHVHVHVLHKPCRLQVQSSRIKSDALHSFLLHFGMREKEVNNKQTKIGSTLLGICLATIENQRANQKKVEKCSNEF